MSDPTFEIGLHPRWGKTITVKPLSTSYDTKVLADGRTITTITAVFPSREEVMRGGV